jgi:hypothetical protein
MELEQRVKTLEQEIKILKGQIQRTLLDVQEQLLVHYHPSLRVADHVAAEEATPARVIPFDMESDVPESKIPAPIISQVQKVTLDDIRKVQTNGNGIPKPQPLLQPAAAPSPQVDGFTRLAEWVDANVTKLGVARTRKLVEIRLQSGGLKPDVAETLLQIVALYEGEGDTAAAHETAHALQELNQLLNL